MDDSFIQTSFAFWHLSYNMLLCAYLDLDKYNTDVCLHVLAFKTMLLFSDSTCSVTYIFNTLNLLIFLFLTDRKGPSLKGRIIHKTPALVVPPLQSLCPFS